MFNASNVKIMGGTFTFVEGTSDHDHTHRVIANMRDSMNVLDTNITINDKNCYKKSATPDNHSSSSRLKNNDEGCGSDRNVPHVKAVYDNYSSDEWTEDEAEQAGPPQIQHFPLGHRQGTAAKPALFTNTARNNTQFTSTARMTNSIPRPGAHSYSVSQGSTLMEAQFEAGDISYMSQPTAYIFDHFMRETFEYDTRSDSEKARDVASDVARMGVGARNASAIPMAHRQRASENRRRKSKRQA